MLSEETALAGSDRKEYESYPTSLLFSTFFLHPQLTFQNGLTFFSRPSSSVMRLQHLLSGFLARLAVSSCIFQPRLSRFVRALGDSLFRLRRRSEFKITIAMERLCHRDGTNVSSRWNKRAIAMVRMIKRLSDTASSDSGKPEQNITTNHLFAILQKNANHPREYRCIIIRQIKKAV